MRRPMSTLLGQKRVRNVGQPRLGVRTVLWGWLAALVAGLLVNAAFLRVLVSVEPSKDADVCSQTFGGLTHTPSIDPSDCTYVFSSPVEVWSAVCIEQSQAWSTLTSEEVSCFPGERGTHLVDSEQSQGSINVIDLASRIVQVGLVTLFLIGSLLLVGVGTAVAFNGYASPVFFSSHDPQGIAVSNASGNVYVYNTENFSVEWFNADGSKLEGEFNGNTSPTGQFVPPATVSEHAANGTLFNLAIDNDPTSPSANDVYVVDPGHNVIDKFSAAGVYLSQLTGFQAPIFGVAVDPAGNVWVAEEGREESGANIGPVQEFDDAVANKHVTEVKPEALRSPGIAVDSAQNLYLLRGEPNVVKFDKEGKILEEQLTVCGCIKGVAVDSGTNDLYTDEGSSIARYGPFGEPYRVPTEVLEGISGSRGIAVNGSTHTVYASEGEANAVAIFKFGLLPDVATGAASEVIRTEAKLEGIVNPDGQEVTACRFEYGTTTEYGQSSPCAPSPGSGSSPVIVSAPATGLSPATTYHFRLVAGNANGSHPGGDATFTTVGAVEGVHSSEAKGITSTTATLEGSLEPNGFDTHYHFEYGPCAALAACESAGFETLTPSTDAGSATEAKSVSATISALKPHQAYHFRLVAENSFGTTTSEERTLLTVALVPLIEGQPTASLVQAQSAVLNASLNPEHIATRYHFEYGPCPTLTGCTGIRSTAEETSPPSYGVIGATQEARELLPHTTYSFRLVTNNELEEEGQLFGGATIGPEGTFTTGAEPAPSALTGGSSAIASTSAIVSGVVFADGLPTSYAFELGVYNGAGTQYGVVFSSSAGSSNIPVEEMLQLSGLQPGTTYAYRIMISSGYIENESHTLQGTPATFTTAGVPAVLTLPSVLAQLPIPAVSFPKPASATKSKTKTHKKKAKKAKRRTKKHNKHSKTKHTHQ